MTTLSPLDVRFACTCNHASGAHPPYPVMKCEQCDCDGYRPARCVCHLSRNDGNRLPCYATNHEPNDARVGLIAEGSVARPVRAEMGATAHHRSPSTDDDLYAAWYARQLKERPEGHAAHRRIRSLTRLWATCQSCFEAKVRKLQASNDVHVRQKANEMAERRGIK